MNTKMIKIASAAAGAAIVAGLAFAGVASAQTPGPSQTPVPGRGPMRGTPPTGAPAYGRGEMQGASGYGRGQMAGQGYGMGGWGGSQVSLVSAAADKLGMTVADLTAELKTGKTIAAVAEAKKVAPGAINKSDQQNQLRRRYPPAWPGDIASGNWFGWESKRRTTKT